MAKEKLVYILNPDGLTESIFVAKGEPNEGQYRGKRFTKAGWKAEKKRLKDEMLAQAYQQEQSYTETSVPLENLKPQDGKEWVKSFEEYEKAAETTSIQIISNSVPPAVMETVETDVMVPETIIDSIQPSLVDFINENNNIIEDTVRIFGTVKGAVFIVSKSGEPIQFRDFPTGFVSKTELLEKLTLMGLKYPKIQYVETETSGVMFSGTAEMF
jgi:hypothetical protein